MNERFKAAAVLMVAVLMVAAVMAVPVLADSGSGGSDDGAGSGSNSGSGVSGSNSGSSAVADDKAGDKSNADIRVKDNAVKVDVRDDQNRLKAETKDDRLKAEVRDSQNKVKIDAKADADKQNAEVRVKTEAKGGFAGVLSRLISSIFGRKQAEQAPAAAVVQADAEARPAEAPKESAGNEPTSPSGQGYALGKLDLEMEPKLVIVQLGEEKVKPGEFELKNRVYEATGLFPVKINDEELLATDIKVKTSLRIRGGVSEFRGGIDLALATGEGIAMQFEGTVTKEGLETTADIDIAITSATGRFLGLIAFEGHHILKIEETENALGAMAEVKIFDISGKDAVQAASASATVPSATATTPAPGITIDKTLSSGPGYPTGPLDISLQPTQLLLDRVGQVKGGEVKDRQYEVEAAAIPVMINGVQYSATEVKVISNLKTKAGAGQHQGTIDIDIDVPLGSALPAGHITLEYKGSATVSGSMITSGGVFKTSKMTGVFAGLVSEGTYSMTIVETGQAFGSPAMVSISTTSSV